MTTKRINTLVPNQLTVCTYWGFPLVCESDNEGNIVGADIQFLSSFAASMGLEINIIPKPFNEIWTLPGKNFCDIAGAGIMRRDDRIPGPEGAWSDDYFPALRSLLVPANQKAEFEDYKNLKNKRIIVTRGSTAHTDSLVRYPNCIIQFVDEVCPSQLNPLEYIVKNLIGHGHADAFGAGDISSLDLLHRYGHLIEGGLALADVHPLENKPENYSFITRNASTGLLEELNRFIKDNKKRYVNIQTMATMGAATVSADSEGKN